MTIDQALVQRLAPTGALRAVINLGNPVLAHGTPDEPGGVTVAIARELASRLEVPLTLECVDAARRSLAALTDGTADVAFLAVEPAREVDVHFSPPYLTIEGVYVVGHDSPVTTAADVDRPGVRVGVKQGSAYDLYLTRTLQHAGVVRGADGVAVYRESGLDVGAGIRQPLTALVAEEASLRLVEPAFMQIQQAVALPRDRGEEAADALAGFVRDLLDSGFVRRELAAAGQDPELAAG
ncbi:transporter substrate-binding domain-containing protein [Nocardioides sp. 503]|uniref:transporter substrate-binding domain-containing protein n=1 Tax=Nocardioides sp. 503 TaxID=2508326 RepID=UPI00106F33B2|nr:transporter substrate-binding domain-containing protein [Nocardioides sp. 503]